MTEPRLLQNFNGGRAFVVTDRASSLDVLSLALTRLGVTADPADVVGSVAAIDAAALQPERDIIFIDGDISDAATLPLSAIGRLPPAPMIGLLGVSAPSRLKALMRAGVTAFLRKPVHGGAVYAALFVGVNEFRRHRYLESLLQDQERRRRGRRDVVKAIIRTMSAYGLDDDAAYDLLRRRCMTTRQTMEDLCRELVLSPAPDDPGEPIPRERRAE
ncbi:MAG: ANTAR domain-containing protein [Tardiphaga sp.]